MTAAAWLARVDAVLPPAADLGRRPDTVHDLSDDLHVWDTSRCTDVYGGNKVRKLERLLGAAQRDGVRDVLTLGATGSHHVLATTAFAAPLGIRTHAVLVPQPTTRHAEDNLRTGLALGLTPRRCRHVGVPLALAREAVRIRRETGAWPRWIPAGGSSDVGVLAWVRAGLEMAGAVAARRLPEPERVVVAFGTGGTAAGLALGLHLAGLSSRLTAVRVVDQPVGAEAQLRWQIRRAARALGHRGALPRPEMVHDALDGGYGHAGSATAEAMLAAQEAGLHVDPTYTGKAFAACLGRPEAGPTLFVQTLSAVRPAVG